MPSWKVEPTCGLWTAVGREPSITLHKLELCKLSTLVSTIVTLLKVGMAEIFHLFFLFARISQSSEVILIPVCRFLLMMPNT